MPDDPAKTGRTWKRISVEQEHLVRIWAMIMGCTQERLREAVRAVGSSVDAVRKYLAQQSTPI
jgi:hypothetical protein